MRALASLLDPNRDEQAAPGLVAGVCIFSQQHHIQHALETASR